MGYLSDEIVNLDSIFSFRNTSTPTLTCIPSKKWGAETDKNKSENKKNKKSLDSTRKESALGIFDEMFKLEFPILDRETDLFNNLGIANLSDNGIYYNNNISEKSLTTIIFNTYSAPTAYVKNFELDEFSLLQSIVKDNLKGVA